MEVLERVNSIAGVDSLLRYGGAKRHGYHFDPPVSAHQVDVWERTHGVVLPADFRAFITTVGRGGPGPGYGLQTWSADQAPDRLKLEDELSVAALPLSDDGCGLSAVLIVSGARTGEVWQDRRVNDGGWQHLAASFDAWYRAWLDGFDQRYRMLLELERSSDDAMAVLTGFHELGAGAEMLRVARRVARGELADDRTARFVLGVLEEHDPPAGEALAVRIIGESAAFGESLVRDARWTLGTLAWQRGAVDDAWPHLVEKLGRMTPSELHFAAEWLERVGLHLRTRPDALEPLLRQPHVAVELGDLLAEAGAHSVALACFDRAAQTWTASISLHLSRATSLQALGHLQSALDAVERAIELDVGDPEDPWDEGAEYEDETLPLRDALRAALTG